MHMAKRGYLGVKGPCDAVTNCCQRRVFCEARGFKKGYYCFQLATPLLEREDSAMLNNLEEFMRCCAADVPDLHRYEIALSKKK